MSITHAKRIIASQLSKTEISKSKKQLEGLLKLLSELEQHRFSERQKDLFEARLADLEVGIQTNTTTRQAIKKFKAFLIKELAMIPLGYHLTMGIGVGLALGTSLGISFGAPFSLPMGIVWGMSIGAGLGLIGGLIWGRYMDQQAEEQERVLYYL